jgi:TonB family protein
MYARPDVTRGPTTIPAQGRARPNDTVDSEQEVATAVRSLVHASTAGGAPGAGNGGTGGGGAPGAGGARGAGSHASPLGTGLGDFFDLDTQDPRLVPYFRAIHRKIDPLVEHAFPRQAAIELRQGTVIFDVTIAPNGTATVQWPPTRPSGIDEFDKNCFDAIRRAAPFGPVPESLGGRALHVRMPFAATRRW